jgi:hypothetical protein
LGDSGEILGGDKAMDVRRIHEDQIPGKDRVANPARGSADEASCRAGEPKAN